ISFVTPLEDKFLNETEDYLGLEITRVERPSREQVALANPAFEDKIESRQKPKKHKAAALKQDIMKLYFNGGKKKKLRAVDFV
ncbi:ATP-dependent helicase, partial [Planococcus sp. SIMBA_143]